MRNIFSQSLVKAMLYGKAGGYPVKSAVFFLCMLTGSVAVAQIAAPPPVINIPTSPEAAMMGRFGDIPVGYYTGTANISIPLYSVKLGNIDIPVVLRYHSSGIKVEDQATWVGLGWDLSPEGSIIQEIRGKPDEEDVVIDCGSSDYYFKRRFDPLRSGIEDPYMMMNQLGRSTATNSCGDGTVFPSPIWPSGIPEDYSDSYCMIDKLTRGFGQPDIYHYNFGGYTGSFYKHPETGEIILIDRNRQIYFRIVNASTIEATTLDGAIWTFDVPETVNGGMVFEYTGKTYKLGKVVLLTGKKVEFAYVNTVYHERIRNESANINAMTGYYFNQSFSTINHNSKTLSTITSKDTKIVFNTTSREDVNITGEADDVKKLSSIDILSVATDKKIKSFRFGYSYFPYTMLGVPSETYVTNNADALGKRLRLDSVWEVGYTDSEEPVVTKPAHRFEYDLSNTMPMKISMAKDFWGYYNGKGNTTLLPNLDYFDYFNKPGYTVINTTPAYPYTGANRFTDNDKSGAYMLKKIVYPTGGYSEFQYEPNSFTNQFIPDQSQPIFKSVDVQENSIGGTISQLFKLSKTVTLHFDNRINNGQGNPNSVTPLTYTEMQDCYIELSKVKLVGGSPQVTLLKRWDLSTVLNADFSANGGKQWLEDMRIEYDPDPNPTFNYLIKVYFPAGLKNVLFSSIAGVTSHITYYDDIGVNTSVSNQCGVRIKTIKNYTGTGQISSDKLIRYSEGKLLNRFRPMTSYAANHLDISGVTGGIAYEYISFYRKVTALGSDFGTGGGNLIGYGKVEEVELANGSENHGKKIFTYLNTENKTGQDRPYTPNLQNGLIAKEEVIDALTKKLVEKTYTYERSISQPAVPNYVCINVIRLSTGSKVPCGQYYDPTVDPFITYYYDSAFYFASEHGFNAYTIHSEWFNLTGTLTKQYFNEDILSTTELYAYNGEGSMKSMTSTNSKGEVMETRYYYPTDPEVNSVETYYLRTWHNTGTPVMTDRFKSGNLLAREKIGYAVFAGVTVLPKYTYTQKGSFAEELRMTIESYDSEGNITQYTAADGIPVSIVWNADKTLPIAKIENATYASLLALPGGLASDFRTSLPNARVTTYTYKPLVGVATITDANNRINYYEYDEYGRLVTVKDQNGAILKMYEYKYGL